MIVVGHQYIGVDPYAKALRKLPPVAAENLRNNPIPKNRLSLNARGRSRDTSRSVSLIGYAGTPPALTSASSHVQC